MSSYASLEAFLIIDVKRYTFANDSGLLITAERNDSLFKIIAYDEMLNSLDFIPKGGTICDIDLELLRRPGFYKVDRPTSGIMISCYNGVEINRECHWSVYYAKYITQLQESADIKIFDDLFVQNIKKNGTSRIPCIFFNYYYKYRMSTHSNYVDISFNDNGYRYRYIKYRTKDAGDGYLFINHLIQNDLRNRKTYCDSIAYFVNGNIVNDSISVCKLVNIRKKGISSLSIDLKKEIMCVDLLIKKKYWRLPKKNKKKLLSNRIK